MLELKSTTSKGTNHKVNQDTASIFNNPDKRLKGFIVYDGHGDYGHVLSAVAAKIVPKFVISAIISGNTDKIEQRQQQQQQNLFLGKEKAIADALLAVDERIRISDPVISGSSGTTVAGVLYDTISRQACMFAVGDSLVGIFEPEMDAIVIEPQNVHFLDVPDDSGAFTSRMLKSSSVIEPIKSVLSNPEVVNRDRRAMVTPDGLLQLYSVLGDFDAKKYNPYVRARPVVAVINRRLSENTKLVVTSDGAYDHVTFNEEKTTTTTTSVPWIDAITAELEQANWSPKILAQRARSCGVSDDITAVIAKI